MKPNPRLAPSLWSIRLDFPIRPAEAMRLAVEAVFENFGEALSSFEKDGGKGWTIEAIGKRRPSRRRLAAALRPYGLGMPVIAPLPPKDWLAESRKGLPPLAIGPFLIHGEHDRHRPTGNKIPLEIDAGIAFGTGRHETTSGCIAAMLRLKRMGFRPRKPLDIGTGTGILAFAAWHLFGVPVLAGDNDKDAVRVARENAAINGLARQIRIVKSEGCRAAAIRNASPYDLIVANILANPLIALAPAFARHAARSGRVVLSGLLREQEKAVLDAYGAAGFALDFRRRRNDWSVLVLRKEKRRSRIAPKSPLSSSR